MTPIHITGHADLLATIEAQRREIAELWSDARRYRWLRDTPYIGIMRTGNIRSPAWGWSVRARTGNWIDSESLDAAIDAAIAGDKP